ncbi:unnamed protein product [Leptosia nina]|uniref:Uncharacterized protein n=1 Tax=Leptosia nina TaxID=320188 RepID=A0AAV1JAZ9_9NEOP
MKESIKSTFHCLGVLASFSIILSVQIQAKFIHEANITDIRPTDSNQMMHATAPQGQRHFICQTRMKRQLLPPILSPLRSRLRHPRLRLPPRRPIILPIITTAISDGIRTYPQYLQEIPLALGETLVGSMRDAAPHISETIKDLTPGLMEIMNTIPESETLHPLQKMVKKIPTMIHDTVQAAINHEHSDQLHLTPQIPLQTETITSSSKRPSTALKETFQDAKDTITSQIEVAKQKAQYYYQNLLSDYKDLSPKKQNSYKQRTKKIMQQSNGISPALGESLTSIAKIPQTIKKAVEQMKQ